MKYIDADKLITEIERLKKKNKELQKSGGSIGQEFLFGIGAGYADVFTIITSLQQEQSQVDLEKEIKDYTETLYHETFGNNQGTLDEFDWEDIAQTIDEAARHFYSLGLNARKEE